MSIIQKIRDKYSRIAVIAIAVALLGFVLIDYISGKSRSLFSSNSNIVGKVNGKSIGINEFERMIKQQEDYMQQRYNQSGEAIRAQAVEQAWDQEVNRILLSDEIDRLGIAVGKKEINDMLFGANPPEDLKRQFTDPQTGQYNAGQALSQINEMKRKGTPEQKESFNTYIGQLEFLRQVDKYTAMLSNSTNFPRWYFEKQNGDNSQLAKISMVREMYTEIKDSTVKVTDKEIENYISKHKEDYKQEENRSIEFVTFSAAPSGADSAEARNKLVALKPEFDSLKDVTPLLAQQGVNNYYSGYIGKNVIKIAAKDSIFKTPVGHVYGPYLDGESYVLAKVEAVKQIPDTVKVRHILIATTQRDQQTNQVSQVRDTVEAKRLIDSVQTLIQKGANFDSVCAKLSEDPGSKDKGGVYDNVPSGQMVSEFNDFIFANPVGTKGIVKTEFGYHYIEILSQKGSTTGYRIAYLPQQIFASDETDKNASNQATVFAGDSRDQKTFDENYEKTLKSKGIIKQVATDITPTSSYVQGVGAARSFVKEIYKTKAGEVMQPERVGDNYIVAVVTEVNEEGTQTVARARSSIEPLLINGKKAALLKQKIGKVTTLEAAATALGKQIETVDSLRMSGSNSTVLGFEPRVNGAAFNPANKGKVVPEPIEGRSGIYVIRVDEITSTAVANANVAEQRKSMYQQTKQNVDNPQNPAYPANILKKDASIKDKRADRY